MTSLRKWTGAAVLLAASGLLSSTARGETDKQTERLWKSKCAACHGVDGKAQTDQGRKQAVADYTTAQWQKGRTDAQLRKAILDGVSQERDGKKQQMDGYKDQLTPNQVDQLVAHIRSLAK